MQKDIRPNHTQIPNDYLDMFMPHLNGAEWKCLCYIARRTFGFQKRVDKISLSQFVSGVKDRDGNQLDYGTGLSKKTIINACGKLVEAGIIKKSEESISKWQVVEKLHPLEVVEKLHRGSGKITPKVVEKLHTQKKGKKVDKIKTSDVTVADPNKGDVDSVIDVFYQTINPTINWGNITTRDAAKFLIDKFGIDETLKVAKYACKIHGKPYAPTITTPHQLKEKLAALGAYIKREKENNNKAVVC